VLLFGYVKRKPEFPQAPVEASIHNAPNLPEFPYAPGNRISLENLVVTEVLKQFPAFYAI
jgi:hypothetical protein